MMRRTRAAEGLPRWVRSTPRLLALSLLVSTIGGMPAVGQEPPPGDPLLRLNHAFRDVYAKARSELLDDLGPVVIVRGDELVLIRGDDHLAVGVIPPIYHRLKSVAHAALAVDLAMRLSGDPMGEAGRAALEQLGGLVREARGRLDTFGFDAEQRPRQEAILDASLDRVERSLRLGRCPEADRVAFAREMGPLVLANARDAARAAIDAYRGQMDRWRADLLTPDQWARLRVVVCDRQMPRDRNLAVQTFARILNVPGECNRLVYAESLTEEPEALGLLGTHLLDASFSVDFFNDPIRMDRDLLGDAAAEYLDELGLDP